jgi:TPR repeat protein
VTNLSARVVNETQYARAAMDKSALGVSGESYLKRGIMHASGRAERADLVAAHKCFNLAAMHGSGEGARLRSEIAREMSSAELVAAQHAARVQFAPSRKCQTRSSDAVCRATAPDP